MSREALLFKIAEKLTDDDLIDLASNTLTQDEVVSLVSDPSLSEEKLANLGKIKAFLGRTGALGKDLLGAGVEIGKEVGQQGLSTLKDPNSYARQLVGDIPGEISRNKGPATALAAGALGAGTAGVALPYLGYRMYANRNQASAAPPPGAQPGSFGNKGEEFPAINEEKLSAAGLTPEIRDHLDKLAEDPMVQMSIQTLIDKGLI